MEAKTYVKFPGNHEYKKRTTALNELNINTNAKSQFSNGINKYCIKRWETDDEQENLNQIYNILEAAGDRIGGEYQGNRYLLEETDKICRLCKKSEKPERHIWNLWQLQKQVKPRSNNEWT